MNDEAIGSNFQKLSRIPLKSNFESEKFLTVHSLKVRLQLHIRRNL